MKQDGIVSDAFPNVTNTILYKSISLLFHLPSIISRCDAGPEPYQEGEVETSPVKLREFELPHPDLWSRYVCVLLL